MKISFLIILLALSALPLFGEEKKEAEPEMTLVELREALGADDFERRSLATQKIWEMGDDALDFLAEMEVGEDPELAARAGRLRLKIRAGILPDTPAEIAEQLEGYHEGSVDEKRSIAKSLLEGNHFEYLVRLQALEEDPKLKKYLNGLVSGVVPKLLRKHLVAGDMESAEKLLRLGTDFISLIRCGNFLELHDKLDAELARLKDSQNPEQQARYLAYLRVKGDPALLLTEARRLGDEKAEATAALLLGDPLPLFRLHLKEQEQRLPNQLYLKLMLARAKKDHAAEEGFISLLVEMANDFDERPDGVLARTNLYRAGLVDEAWKAIPQSEWPLLINHHLTQGNHVEILDVLGMGPEGLTDEWLKDKVTEMRARLETQKAVGSLQDRLFQAAAFYDDRGEFEFSARILKGFFDGIRGFENKAATEWTERLFAFCPHGAVTAIAYEVDEFELGLREIVHEMFDAEASVMWLFDEIQKAKPEITTEKLLQIMASYQGTLMITTEELDQWNKHLEEVARQNLKKQDKDAMSHLLNLWRESGRASDVWRLLEIPEFLEGREYQKARLAVDLERWEEARALFEGIEPDLQTVYPTFLYRKGLALQKGGDAEAGQKLIRDAYFYGSGESGFLASISYYHGDYGESEVAYELMKKSLLRSEDSVMVKRYSRFNLLARLGESALMERKWKEAAAFLEAATIPAVGRTVATPLNARFKTLLAQGIVAHQEGRAEEAQSILGRAHALVPASGGLADDYFPALRENGLVELHDRLCEKSFVLLRKNIETFPNDHSAKNTFGWVASRANRNLNEAETLMQQALKEMPLSAAFLDTMAEVQFAMGKREEAVRWSRQSVDLQITDTLIRQQLRRFQKGEFPAK